jgi:hypothetical protein
MARHLPARAAQTREYRHSTACWDESIAAHFGLSGDRPGVHAKVPRPFASQPPAEKTPDVFDRRDLDCREGMYRDVLPLAADQPPASVGTASPDGAARLTSDLAPPDGVDFDVIIGPHDEHGAVAVAYKFASLDDATAYRRLTEDRVAVALVRVAREHVEPLLAAGQPAPQARGGGGRQGSSASSRERALDTDTHDKALPPKFMKVADYAAHTGYSKRTIENFVREGLPTVGKRRLLRIDVEPADKWIRGRAAREDDEQDAVEQEARDDARRGSRRGGPRG